MYAQLAIIAAIVAVVALAARLTRKNPTAEPALSAYAIPEAIDRSDFRTADGRRFDQPWLVAVFTSDTCATCEGVAQRAAPLASDSVGVALLSVQAEPDLHRRYAINAVPLTLLVDESGTVRTSFAGPVSSTHLWGALAELREPGSAGGGCEGSHGTHDHGAHHHETQDPETHGPDPQSAEEPVNRS